MLDIAGAAIKVGMTTDEIDRIVHEATVERNAYLYKLLVFIKIKVLFY